MDSPKISIVIPMFNEERFVRMCIDSILNQTFKDFELILIDDKSTDSTLDQIPKDSRIKLIKNDENLGLPKSRNIGLNSATSDLVMFIDADDAIFPQALETLFTAAKESESDVVHMNSFFETVDEAKSLESEISAEQVYDADSTPRVLTTDFKERIERELLRETMLPMTWLNLYRRKFLIDNKITFPEVQCCSDWLYHYTTLMNAQKFMVLDSACYLHRIHSDGISSTKPDKKLRTFISNLPKILESITNIFERELPIKLARSAIDTLKIHVYNRLTHFQVEECFAGAIPFELIEQIEREEFEKFSLEDFKFVSIIFNANIANLFRSISLMRQQQVVKFDD